MKKPNQQTPKSQERRASIVKEQKRLPGPAQYMKHGSQKPNHTNHPRGR